MVNVIVSTGDINKDYEIIEPVHVYHSSTYDKETFGKQLSVEELFPKLVDRISKKCQFAYGDGIIFLRLDWQYIQEGYSASTVYNMYGTAVKIKSD